MAYQCDCGAKGLIIGSVLIHNISQLSSKDIHKEMLLNV